MYIVALGKVDVHCRCIFIMVERKYMWLRDQLTPQLCFIDLKSFFRAQSTNMAEQIWLESPTLANIVDFFKNYPLHTSFTAFLEHKDAFAFFWGLVSFALTASTHDNQLSPDFQWVEDIKKIAASGQITTPEPRIILKHSASEVSSNAMNKSQAAATGATILVNSASAEQNVPDAAADSRNGSLLEEFEQWSGDPSSFWDQSAKPLQLTQATYVERFQAFLAQALKEGSQLQIQVILTQPANIEVFRGFRMHTLHTLRDVSQFQMQIYQYRFTCVLAYQFWIRFSSSTSIYDKVHKLTSPRIREFLRIAGLPPDNESACSDVLFSGRRRYEFCRQLQPNGNDVDYGPLFRPDIPDAIWDRPTPYARKKFEKYLEISRSKNISRWSEESGAQSAAKAILDFRHALIWPDWVHLHVDQPHNNILSQQIQFPSLLSTARKRQRSISPTNINATSSLIDPEVQFIQHSKGSKGQSQREYQWR
ncbi:hypothetical protein GGI43DRAFT_92980 [Trichoderma evansii]